MSTCDHISAQWARWPFMRTLDIRHLTEYHYCATARLLPHRLFCARAKDTMCASCGQPGRSHPPLRALASRRIRQFACRHKFFAVIQRAASSPAKCHSSTTRTSPKTIPWSPTPSRFPFQYNAVERVELAPFQQVVFAKAERALRAWVSEFRISAAQVPGTESLSGINVHS